jgi:catalase
VGARLGAVETDAVTPLQVDVTLEAAPSVLFDALIIPDGEPATALFLAAGQAVEFVKDQYRHCKPILAIGSGQQLLEAAKIPATLPSGDFDPALLTASAAEADAMMAKFVAAVARHRHFGRQTDPPRV